MSLLPPSSNTEIRRVNAVSPPASPSFSPNLNGRIAGPANNQGFDFLGPLQRRKYMVALFCIVGAALGYLYYEKVPKTYKSAMRILVTTNAPPVLADGNLVASESSVNKFAHLISSETFLQTAVELLPDDLKTFEGEPFPELTLMRMISVRPDQESGAVINLTCVGEHPNELPQLLDSIQEAFVNKVTTDSVNAGGEAANLINSLVSKLDSQKDFKEDEYKRLFEKLGITSTDRDGNVVNPHNQKLSVLESQFDESDFAIRDIENRLKSLKLAVESKDENTIRVVALEARDYLGLRPQEFEPGNGFAVSEQQTMRLPGLRSRNDLENKIWGVEGRITELNFQLSDLTRIYGRGHSKVKALRKQISFYEQELAELQADLGKYSAELERLEKEANAELAKMAEAGVAPDLKTFREREQNQWIVMYQLALKRELERLGLKQVSLANAIKTTADNAKKMAEDVMKMNLLREQIDQKREAAQVIMDRLSEIQILADQEAFKSTTVDVLDLPKFGGKIAPSLFKSLFLGSLLALIAGYGLALLVDQGELAFRSPQEISEKLNVMVTGRIPRINVRRIKATKGDPALIAAHQPGSTAAEAFRDVRTALFFQASMDDIKTILFTSPSPGDGKSTTVANLAISMAQAGKRVVLVDADFRRPRVDRYFDTEMSPGVTDVLSGEATLVEALQTTELQDKLYLLTAGGRPKNPGELVTSEGFHKLIEALRNKFDYVLIDSPPVLPVSDPTSIASIVDGVFMVTRIRKGVKVTTQRAKETLARVGTNFLGIIVNGIDENPHYTEYGYQYGQYSYHGGRYGKYFEANNKYYRDKIEKVQG